MVGVTFKINGEKLHSEYDLGLILTSKSIEVPKRKEILVDIPGTDGVLDFSAYFGGTKYNRRTIKMNFVRVCGLGEFMEVWEGLQNKLCGKEIGFAFDEEPNMFFTGTIVPSYVKDKNIATFTLTATCEPYKVDEETTTVQVDADSDGKATITIDFKQKTEVKLTADNSSKFFANNKYIAVGTSATVIIESGLTTIRAERVSTPATYIKCEYNEVSL